MKSLFDSSWAHFPKSHLVATSGLTICLTAIFSLWPSKDAEAIRHEHKPEQAQTAQQLPKSPLASAPTHSLAPPDLFPQDPEPQFTAPHQIEENGVADVEPELPWQKVVVKPGDNLSLIFKRTGLTPSDVYRFVSSQPEAKALTKLRPGEFIELQIDPDNALQALRYQPNQLETHQFNRTDDGFAFEKITQVPDIRMVYRTATIDSSLFLAGSKAGLEDGVIMEIANIFGWDIDFVLDIREGDDFKVLYEEKYLQDDDLGYGNIMAAEFTNRGKTYRAVRYTDESGDSQYFTPDGQSMRKEFLRTPVDFARISSHFNLSRKHPVLNTIRAHKGTDYAAPTGTPIRAVGDGKVIFAGRSGGYGNVVKIQHGQTYQTRYAHMSKFQKGVRSGSTVKQGQIIGYVGSTGLATGPHLHYEFYVNGAVRNPVTVKLPKARSVPDKEMLRFAQQTQPLLVQLGYMGNSQLALKDQQEQKSQ